MNSYVIDVQRCSIHDGPGIRTTVFLKGCPLKCQWCHNPESQCFDKQLSFNNSLCTSCGQCIEVCKNNVHSMVNGVHSVNYSKCTKCGQCIDVCQTKALSIIGQEMTPKQVFDIVKKDEIFYLQGNGGVTISGGEALSHIDFCLELLKLCKASNIHTCIETSGYANQKELEKILDYVDLFLFDCKVTNDDDFKKYIGGSLKVVKENFNFIYNKNKKIILRCPIIPTINDNKEHFDNIIILEREYTNLVGIEILPYHNFGTSKSNNIGKEIIEFNVPTKELINEWITYFKQNGSTKIKLA